MADPSTALDSWPAIIAAGVAALTALLVPLTSFVKTLLDYRVERQKAEPLKPDKEVVKEMTKASGPAMLEAVLITDLTVAVKELTAQMKALQASEEATHNTRIEALTAQLAKMLSQMEGSQGPPPTRGWGNR